MALRLLGSTCWIVAKSKTEKSGRVSHMFCQSKIRGMSCPLKDLPGKKAFELSGECFELVGRPSFDNGFAHHARDKH